MFFIDPTYIIFVMLPAAVISGLAQLYLRNAYGKWSNIRNEAGVAGGDVAERIKRTAGLQDVGIQHTEGELSDHYDPRDNVVRMSPGVARSPSVASMAIMAHELGHAQQYQEGSLMITARQILVPAVSVSPTVAYGLILAGLFFQFTQLAWIGVLVFSVSVIFMLLTLPVEIDASMRGMRLLDNAGLLHSSDERSGAKAVLTAAALTYVAAAITSLLQLFYFASLVSGRD